MNSIFLRIYGGMLAVLVLVALLGVGALQLLNDVRVDQYRERLAQGTFRLMADNLAPMVEIGVGTVARDSVAYRGAG